ncbi:MAG: hypothetical protein WB646_01830 [Steroidobacteraceae bacterium]
MTSGPASVNSACAGCVHLQRAALELELRLPGLRTLSSAFASVRSGDGLCALHDRYVAASSVCAQHRAVAAVLQPRRWPAQPV